MQLRMLLGGFLAWVLYPLWLIGGAVDYVCHRRSDIQHTSGIQESWLHVAQFLTMALVFVSAVVLQITLPVVVALVILVVAHTVLSFIDVSYTLGRRHISPSEQHAHGLLNVVPLVAIGLLAILNWQTLLAPSTDSVVRLKDEPLSATHVAMLLGSFGVFAGGPVLEEWLRTYRARVNVS
jgi:NADH:ubiquinone oxidoreductase subunit 6 (subunit J)